MTTPAFQREPWLSVSCTSFSLLLFLSSLPMHGVGWDLLQPHSISTHPTCNSIPFFDIWKQTVKHSVSMNCFKDMFYCGSVAKFAKQHMYFSVSTESCASSAPRIDASGDGHVHSHPDPCWRVPNSYLRLGWGSAWVWKQVDLAVSLALWFCSVTSVLWTSVSLPIHLGRTRPSCLTMTGLGESPWYS